MGLTGNCGAMQETYREFVSTTSVLIQYLWH